MSGRAALACSLPQTCSCVCLEVPRARPQSLTAGCQPQRCRPPPAAARPRPCLQYGWTPEYLWEEELDTPPDPPPSPQHAAQQRPATWRRAAGGRRRGGGGGAAPGRAAAPRLVLSAARLPDQPAPDGFFGASVLQIAPVTVNWSHKTLCQGRSAGWAGPGSYREPSWHSLARTLPQPRPRP